jgi:hypothetical protein
MPPSRGVIEVQHSAHRVYIGFLLGIAVITTIAGGLYGAEYYLTPLADRPFHPQYDELKPTGAVGHGYGIVGSLMIIAGVSMYSSRKRLRLLSGMGKLPLFLEFHIFLCLTGPILVLYHTTFKFGGLVAVSFWSMTAIVLSGVVGRYLYVQIPRGIHGHELNAAELAREQSRLTSSLIDEFGLRPDMIARVDRLSGLRAGPARAGFLTLLKFLVIDDLVRPRMIRSLVHSLGLQGDVEHRLTGVIRTRHTLHRRIVFLENVRRLFHYWHVIHVPFSIVMFIILFVHVGVAIAFGYTWVF